MASSISSALRISSSTSCAETNYRKSTLRNTNPSFGYRPFKEYSIDSILCRCQKRSDSPSPQEERPGWDSILSAAKNAVKWWNNYVNTNRDSLKSGNLGEVGTARGEKAGDWDWERWRQHFEEVEEQERLVTLLKSQLGDAVHREDYEDAAKIKVAMAAAARNDTVGQAISYLERALKEEHYEDAAFIRDHAGAGLVGWWAGVSEDAKDPYGRIIHISAEHGRYVARSYSSRQLATATPGVPLFEVYFTLNHEGEYRQQAVYLKRNRGNPIGFLAKRKPSDVITVNPLPDSMGGINDSSVPSTDDTEDSDKWDEDPDVAEGLAGIQSILRDMIPGVKVKVLTVIGPEKIDKDLIFKALEQDLEEEEEEDQVEEEEENDNDDDEDIDLGSIDDPQIIVENEKDEIEIDDMREIIDSRDSQSQMAVKVVIGGLVQKLSSDMNPKALSRVQARLEKRGCSSFSFSILKDEDQTEGAGKKLEGAVEKTAALQSQRSMDLVMSDLAKVLVSKEKIPMKVLKDVGELINLTLSQAQNQQPLSGSTIFNRIEIPATSDPLNGVYMGAHGVYTSEIIHLRRKFGQWPDEGGSHKSPNLEFYEYVEALKLTGDPYVPAGQVAFRAKVGKRNQLPHKGIIPEELGVVARYKGQGRLAEPGFRNPRWVDGELVILDGKYIKGGPVVGFIYWAPEYHFLVFFHRLRLQS
ncbi:protein EXECUTER 1, chloroplastic-like [Aristolochia californica]|uniref:protein EXECUTER 1, chloroplastic-like n=1 Tax=Aristolochia californica TaxID=171875 RepID=UPI0035D55994